MSRQKGDLGLTSTIETLLPLPLDARFLVQTKADLSNTAMWQIRNSLGVNVTVSYKGMVVAVNADSTPSNNGLWVLMGASVAPANWKKLALLDDVAGVSVITLHGSTGSSTTDGMTQKAITDALGAKAGSAHVNEMTAHGATSDATAERIVMRDASGRAKIATPLDGAEIANKSYVDTEAGKLRIKNDTDIPLNGFVTYNAIGFSYTPKLKYICVRGATYLRVKEREKGFKLFYNTRTIAEATRSSSGYLFVLALMDYSSWAYSVETDGVLEKAIQIPFV